RIEMARTSKAHHGDIAAARQRARIANDDDSAVRLQLHRAGVVRAVDVDGRLSIRAERGVQRTIDAVEAGHRHIPAVAFHARQLRRGPPRARSTPPISNVRMPVELKEMPRAPALVRRASAKSAPLVPAAIILPSL